MSPRLLRQLRLLHFYLGLFFAPMLLLFAVSGALQVYRLNEEKGYGGLPPVWMTWIAAIHKNQAPPRAKPSQPSAKPAAAPAPRAARAKPGMGVALLKLFAVLLAVGLALSTVLGTLIALGTRSMRRPGIILLIAGTILPILFLKLA